MRPPVTHPSLQLTSAVQTTPMLREQSLSFVEIFLNAAIATVLYSRELFKHNSSVFAERCVADLLDDLYGPVTYEDFLDLRSQARQTKSQVFKILLKGKSQKADKILTLLEGGIFSALQSRYLEAIQLSICADPSRPSEVVECYTFTVTYSATSRLSRRNISGVRVTADSRTVFFAGDAQKSFNAAIKGLLKFLRGLPQLPRRRNLGLNLFYTDECPASYEPRGFTSCVDDNLRFPGGPALARRSKKTPSLVVGSHRVGVVVSHVDSTEEEDLLRVIPEELDYPNKRSRLDEYKATSSETTVDQAELSSQPLPAPSQPPLPSDIVASPAAPSTQTRDDMQTKEALQRMQRSSSRPRDLIPTQSLVHADDLDNEDSNGPDQSYFNAILNTTQTADRRERMIVPAKMAELIVHIKAVQERCSPSDRIFDEGALNNYVIKRKATPNVIKCECIDDSEEGIMLFCEVCGTWQHQSCYGWDSVEEKLRPVDHVCYSCLLLPEEKDLNDWMPILVGCRNALKYLYEHGFPDDGHYGGLIEAMRFKGRPQDLFASNIIQILAKQQLIETAFGCNIIEVNRQKGMVEYVDPLASIFHLYQTHTNKDVPLPSITKDAVTSLEQTYRGFALDAIRTHNSFGDEIIRYGYYPRLAAIQSRKRSASVAGMGQGSQQAAPAAAGAGAGGIAGGLEAGKGRPNTLPRPTRRMSTSELVCFDESSSEVQTQSEETVLESNSDSGSDGGDDDEFM